MPAPYPHFPTPVNPITPPFPLFPHVKSQHFSLLWPVPLGLSVFQLFPRLPLFSVAPVRKSVSIRGSLPIRVNSRREAELRLRVKVRVCPRPISAFQFFSVSAFSLNPCPSVFIRG